MVQLTQEQLERVRSDGAHEWHKMHQDKTRALPKCRDCRYFDAGDCNNPQLAVDLVNGLPAVTCDTARAAEIMCGPDGAWFQNPVVVMGYPAARPEPNLLAEAVRVLATGVVSGAIFFGLNWWLP